MQSLEEILSAYKYKISTYYSCPNGKGQGRWEDTAHHDAKLAANDLEIYFRGFEVAIRQNKIDDAVHCLNKMKGEIDYNLKSLQPS